MSERSTATALVAGAVVVANVVLVATGYANRAVYVFDTLASSLTLVMLFVIQHTQARQEAVTQRKLDEILRALPTADERLVSLETAPTTELEQLGHDAEALRATAVARTSATD